ncbi:MAG: baseplate J/gp47 family protein [Roseburia sp.]
MRYQESFNERAFAGNAKDYHDKTLGIAGVGAVKVIRGMEWSGNGQTCDFRQCFRKATDVLIQTVQKEFDPNKDGHGDGLAPIGHAVTVDTASEVAVNIAARR